MKNGKGWRFLGDLTLVVTKALEIIYWFDAALLAVMAVFSLAAGERFRAMLAAAAARVSLDLDLYGLTLTAADAASLNVPAVRAICLSSLVPMVLTALVFRGVYRIVKSSRGGTPFRPENVRRLRWIGIFSIAVPVVGLAGSAAVQLALGAGVKLNVDLSGFATGILVFCLTLAFAHGAALEQDVEGLV